MMRFGWWAKLAIVPSTSSLFLRLDASIYLSIDTSVRNTPLDGSRSQYLARRSRVQAISIRNEIRAFKNRFCTPAGNACQCWW